MKHLKDNADLIHKSFVVTGISNKLKGSEYHLIRNDIPDIFTEDNNDILFEGFTAEEVQAAINALLLKPYYLSPKVGCNSMLTSQN